MKVVLLAPKGKFRGIQESDFIWNGGAIYPIEVEGTQQDCNDIVRKLNTLEKILNLRSG